MWGGGRQPLTHKLDRLRLVDLKAPVLHVVSLRLGSEGLGLKGERVVGPASYGFVDACDPGFLAPWG